MKALTTLAAALLYASTSFAADAELVEAGRQLFHDPGLSASSQTACASCHPVTNGLEGHTTNHSYAGLDVVADGDPAGRSSPTLWGAGRRTAWSWAGTAPSLEANIRGIIVNRMKGAEPSEDQLAALAAYVRSLPLPATPHVDDEGVSTDSAPALVKQGRTLFVESGCVACHQTGSLDSAGPYDVGSGPALKAPSLWAVKHTGPWFHDGRYATLSDAAAAMWRHLTSVEPSADDLAAIVAYLEAL